MKKLVLLLVVLLIFISKGSSQISITTDGSLPHGSAMLDLKATDKGFLPPRMTSSQMNAITSPAEGLTIYNTTLRTLCWFDGSSWVCILQDGKSCGSINYGGKTYETVILGYQCWMKQNLNIGNRIDDISEQTNNAVIEKYCYGNVESNCDVFGGLYQWNEMMNWTASSNSNPSGIQGICPPGWHLPSDNEWCQLVTYIDQTINCSSTGWTGTDAGGKMKEPGITHWATPNTGATNSSHFTAFAGGLHVPGGGFNSLFSGAIFWSATEISSSNAWYLHLHTSSTQVYHNNDNQKLFGFSCRCLKD